MTEQNNRITFENDDKLERKPLAERLTQAITTFYPFTKEAYVLSLNAFYGTGKTTFLKLWKSHLEDEGHKVMYLSAWESDFDDEPIIPIISSLIRAITEKDQTSENVKKAMQGALGAAALIGNSVLKKVSGVDAKETMEAVEKDLKETDLIEKGKDIFKEYSFKEEAYSKLKESLEEYVANLETKPLIILVDELDRCRPDYAVKFLEAIKHIFSVRGICFVLAVDKRQLEKSVKQLYGDITFSGYYRRFITREIELPEVKNIENTRPLIEYLAEDYFDEKRNGGINFAFTHQQESVIISRIEIISKIFNLTPREISLLFRIYCQYMTIKKNTNTFYDTWLLTPIILIAIRIKDEESYNKLGNDLLSPEEIIKYINSLYFSGYNAEDHKRFMIYDMLAFSLTAEDKTKQTLAAVEIKTRYSTTEEEKDIIASLARRVDDFRDFPHKKSSFNEIYSSLESWKDFLNK